MVSVNFHVPCTLVVSVAPDLLKNCDQLPAPARSELKMAVMSCQPVLPHVYSPLPFSPKRHAREDTECHVHF